MVLIRTNLVIELPKECPKCGRKLHYVNALETEARLFMVFCKNSKCRYCSEVQIVTSLKNDVNKKIERLGKEVKIRCL